MSTKHFHQSGLTLVELVTVIFIVVLLSVRVGPLFFSTSFYEKNVFQVEVLNTLKYARKVAMATNAFIKVSLTSTTVTVERVTFTSATSCVVNTTSAVFDPTTNAAGYVRTAPGNVTLTYSGNWPIYFNAIGQALYASNCAVGANDMTVSVTGQNTITVYGQTGFIQ